MLIVLDTNVLISALITPGGLPDRLLQAWEANEFALLTASEQLLELERVLGYEKLQRFIRPEQSEQLVARLREFASVVGNLPSVKISADDTDNVILSIAIAGRASYLVTGDKAHLLNLKQVSEVPIITVREAIEILATDRGSRMFAEE